MRSPEIFYLHINGEQRGPYTIRHIDHLLNSGLITVDALFWREGLEQWQPVTQLVTLRRPREKLQVALFAGVLSLGLALLLFLFGPIALEGWREIYQHDFSRDAAYWRARESVRIQQVPKGMVVEFASAELAEVELELDDSQARVMLPGTLADSGGVPRSGRWVVELRFDPLKREWSPLRVSEFAP